MKIIICGAGNVGRSVVKYLSQTDDQLVVIDEDQKLLDEVSSQYDVLTVLGDASHPEILERAGAQDASVLLALSDSEQKNMLACQVAYSIFNIEKKVARIDSKDLLEPIWNTLYNEKNIPIDLAVSPNMEIAKHISSLLEVPEACELIKIAGDDLQMVAVKCQNGCHLMNKSIANWEKNNLKVDVVIIAINRNKGAFIPNKDDVFEAEDIVYFLCKSADVEEITLEFSNKKTSKNKIVIFGSNEITKDLLQLLDKEHKIDDCKVIEEDLEKAKEMVQETEDTVVINGGIICDSVLKDACIEDADVVISVTDNDKDNILSSLIAQRHINSKQIALINSDVHDSLLEMMSDTILVNRSAVTISSILRMLRQPRLDDAYSLGNGFAELWKISIGEMSPLVGQKISDISLPLTCKICAIIRDKEIIYPKLYDEIMLSDELVIIVMQDAIKKLEKLLS